MYVNDKNKKEIEEAIVRCSNSCIRSGLSTLILSALAIFVILTIARLEEWTALYKYVHQRNMLKVNLDLLSDNTCFQEIDIAQFQASSHKKIRLYQLVDYSCKDNDNQIEILKQDKSSLTNQPQSNKNIKDQFPPAPGNIRILERLSEITDIIVLLSKMGDIKTLSSIKEFDLVYAWQIYRWQNLWGSINNKNKFIKIEGSFIHNKTVRGLLAQENHFEIYEALRLSIEDIEQLSTYEFPDVEKFMESYQRFNRVQLTPIGLNVSVGIGSVAIGAIIAIIMAYFWLNLKEARKFEIYPSNGTIFSIFNRTQKCKILFGLLACLPVISCIIMCVISKNYISAVPTVIILFLSFRIIKDI
jgi:hypothetical protein